MVLVDNQTNLTLTNGLISRHFITKNELGNIALGTIDYRSETKQQSILRAVYPEAYVTLDGFEYPIGAMQSPPSRSYLNTSNLTVLPNFFYYSGYTKSSPVAPFHWMPGLRHSPSDGSWPPKGLTVSMTFKPPKNVQKSSHADILVIVNYEMYVGVPILAKWLTIENTGSTPVTVDSVVIEYLGVQKPYAPLSLSSMAHPWEHDTAATTASWLYVEANVPHGASIQLGVDSASASSPGADEPTLNCSYSIGPGIALAATSNEKKYSQGNPPIRDPLAKFDTYRVLELVTDSYDRERVALSRHRMTRLLAPQTQENPIFFHGTDSSTTGFKNSIDQMSAVGFEMYIYSFGSGFKLEDLSPTNIEMISADIQYAKSKGIEVGG